MAKKTTSITFRIDEDDDAALRRIADEQKVSLNSLVNKIFSQYLERDILAENFGMLKMSTDTFRRILSKISEKDIIDLATRVGSQEAKEFILFKWSKINIKTVSEFIQMLFDYCGYGRCNLKKTESEISVSVHHDLKEKGTLYLKYFLESLVKTTLNKECITETTEDVVVINFQR